MISICPKRVSYIDLTNRRMYIAGGFIMHVGVCQIQFRLPENLSLKGKRRVLKSITARVGSKFNVSIAEVDDNDVWQLATLGICCVSNNKRHANQVLSRVVEFISNGHFEIEILNYNIEIVPVF